MATKNIMANYKRVFQIGFDVAEGENITEQDRQDLCMEIAHLIENFYDIKGKALEFRCVNGEFPIIDMSHAYGEIELKEINKNN